MKGPKHVEHRVPAKAPASKTFDYGVLAASIRRQVHEETDAIRRLVVNTASTLIQIGLRLEVVRNILGGQAFQDWLEVEFHWSQSFASNCMQVARTFQEVKCLDRFHASALVELARSKTTKDARAEALERAQRGELITKKMAVAIIRKHSPLQVQHSRSIAAQFCATVERLVTGLSLLNGADAEQVRTAARKLLVRLDETILVNVSPGTDDGSREGSRAHREPRLIIDETLKGRGRSEGHRKKRR